MLPLLLLAVAVFAADTPSDHSEGAVPQLTTKRHETRDDKGEVYAYGDTFYRGGERILIQATYTKPQPSGIKMWREYIVGGHTVLKEMDYGDKKPGVVLTYEDDIPHEAFYRHADGSVEPFNSEELARLKRDWREFSAGLEALMKSVAAAAQTNSPDNVMRELKKEVNEYKQQHPNGNDNK